MSQTEGGYGPWRNEDYPRSRITPAIEFGVPVYKVTYNGRTPRRFDTKDNAVTFIGNIAKIMKAGASRTSAPNEDSKTRSNSPALEDPGSS